MPPVTARTELAIWRVDSASVRSGIRDVAKQIDREVGNGDGRISTAEADLFIAARRKVLDLAPREARYDVGTPQAAAHEDVRTAEALKSHLAEEAMPLAVDVALVAVRRPMTAFSDWLGRSIMGD